MMKKCLIIAFVGVLLLACTKNAETILDDVKPITGQEQLGSLEPENNSNCKHVLDFLKHYAKNYNKIYEKDFISYGNVYSVDFKAVDHFVDKAELPHYFTAKYITRLNDKFHLISSNLKVNPQNDGPVDGLEGDFILHTQEPEELISQINTGNMKCTEITRDKVSVDFGNSHILILKFKDYQIDDIHLK